MKYLIFSIIVLTGCHEARIKQLEKQDSLKTERQFLLEAYVGAQSERIDSLESVVYAQGQGLVYLDSIVQERKFKRDRWGKAGAFIGGVIKAVK